MEATFEIIVDEKSYSVSPGDNNNGTYLIQAGDVVFAWIQADENEHWVEIDPFSKAPLGGEYDEHLNAIGNQIDCYFHYEED